MRCDVVENACGARGDSNSSSSSRAARGSAWLSWNQPGAKMWRWDRDQRCVGARLPSVSLGGKRDLHKFPHIQNGSIVWNFLLTGNIPPLIVFWFFKRFPPPPSPGCAHPVNIWVESLVVKSEDHRFVFNEPTWRSNLLYGIVVNEGALF